jgi:hypothetical protein
MPFTYQIDAERNLVTLEATGSITPNEAFATFDEVIAHPDYRPDMKVLSDHRELESVMSVEFVKTFLGRVSQMREALRQARWAFVERGLVRYGMARMASILCDPLGLQLRAFRSMSEAREWLGLEEE